jgi:rfaE bifunctional protein nucleotidyltransferase chain/domain
MILVAANGCFDILHIGHLRHLKVGRGMGGKLIVFLTMDKHVNKGEGRPVFSYEQRKEMLLALRCVDDVIMNTEPTPDSLILKFKPQIFIKGSEYIGRLPEQALVESYGGRVVFTNERVYSSTKLVSFV